jgi:hypothetical protein
MATSDPRSSGLSRRAPAVEAFVTFLRWTSVIFAIAIVLGTAVLAVRAPDCIAIGVSVLRGEDCTNRETYYLLLAAGSAISLCFCPLLFAASYGLELLHTLARQESTQHAASPKEISPR